MGPEGTVKTGLDWKQMAFQRPADPNRRLGLGLNRKFDKRRVTKRICRDTAKHHHSAMTWN